VEWKFNFTHHGEANAPRIFQYFPSDVEVVLVVSSEFHHPEIETISQDLLRLKDEIRHH